MEPENCKVAHRVAQNDEYEEKKIRLKNIEYLPHRLHEESYIELFSVTEGTRNGSIPPEFNKAKF